jgi:hypothetical protein
MWMESPRAGRLRDIPTAERMLGGGSDIGVLMVKLDFLWETVKDGNTNFDEQYESFILSRLQEVKDDIDDLVIK